MAYILIFGYLTALIISFAKWQGFKLAVKKHAITFCVLLILSILFIALGGAEYIIGVVSFSMFVATILGMIAGLFGFVLGLFIGMGTGVISAFYLMVF